MNEFENHENWSKRFLPHYNSKDKYQMITYRLADSLPQSIIQKLQEGHSENKAMNELERRKLFENSLDKGYGSCLLSKPDVAQKVIEAWDYFDQVEYEKIAYTVMPNHIHILIRAFDNKSIGQLVWSWKKFVSSYVFSQSEYVEELKVSTEKKYVDFSRLSLDKRGGRTVSERRDPRDGISGTASERRDPRFWQPEYWDRFIRDEKHMANALDYIMNNPVKAGLVKVAEDWPWSWIKSNS